MGRIDGLSKASGTCAYVADIRLPGMLHASVVRSPFPHARIRRVETAQARAAEGVQTVVAADDVSAGLFGRWVCDIPILARGKVRFVGEPVAAVAAESREAADRAAGLVLIDYEPLPAVFDAEEALSTDAPALHDASWTYHRAVVAEGDPLNLQSRCLWAGGRDVEEALAQAAYTVELSVLTPFSHQGYLEPQACIASVEPGGLIRVWATNKNPFKLREQLAAGMGVEEAMICVEPIALGGDFGGKGAPSDVPLCIELARHTGRPVKLVRRYAEELMASNPRHASRINVRVGCDGAGHLAGLDVRCLFNGGAYAGYKPVPHGNVAGAEEAGAWYRLPAIRIESSVAYTNSVPGGHRRAPGTPQMIFAVESAIDELARRAGLDPAEFRALNVLRTGDAAPLGERWIEARGLETLSAARAAFRPLPPGAGLRHGVGYAVYNAPMALGRTSLSLRAEPDGGVTAFVPQPEQGAGAHTVVRNLLSEGLGLPPERVAVRQVSTADLPYDEGVGASRVTASISEAVRLACDRFRADRPAAGQMLTVETNPRMAPQVTSFCVQIAQVAVDMRTGAFTVLEILTANDVAAVINPKSHRVQIEGSVAEGYSFACLEDLAVVDGRVSAANLGDFKLASHRDVPPIKVVLVPGGIGVGPYNVKAIGEVANVPVVAAIANAIRDAVGVRPTRLPLSAEEVWRQLQEAEGAEVHA